MELAGTSVRILHSLSCSVPSSIGRRRKESANVKLLEAENQNNNKNSRNQHSKLLSRRGTSRQNSTKSSKSDEDAGHVLPAGFHAEKGIERGDDNVYSASAQARACGNKQR